MFTGPAVRQTMNEPTRHRAAIYGAGVELECSVPYVRREIRTLFGPFAAYAQAARSQAAPCVGTVLPYDHSDVVRHLSSSATIISQTPDLAEIYQEGERFWLVDDRWGVCELNLLKGVWRSWVIPEPKLDAYRCSELAVLWPMAQLMRGRGVHLLPAASISRDGWGALLISPFGLGPELLALVQAGYQLIGQRWTAIRDDREAVTLLPIPGRVERPTSPRRQQAIDASEMWVNLAEGRPWATAPRAQCQAIFVADHGRRPKAHLREIETLAAVRLLRRNWPIPELHPTRRYGPLASRLAQSCRCREAQLSRDPLDLLALFDAVRNADMVSAAAVA